MTLRFLPTVVLLALAVTEVHAQCAPGIPGAGNPGCIPPSAPNSPYNNHAGDYPPPGNPNGPPARWRDSWGAVAMDEGSGAAGVAVNEVSKSSASTRAMNQCSVNGAANCKIIITYNNQCVAVAQERKSAGAFLIAAGRAEQADADDYVMSKCSSHGTCDVVYHACSYAVKVQ